jgi:hypothetical protein
MGFAKMCLLIVASPVILVVALVALVVYLLLTITCIGPILNAICAYFAGMPCCCG